MISELLKNQQPRRESPSGSKHYDCPVCGGLGKLEVRPQRGMWWCHKCGRGGRWKESHRFYQMVETSGTKATHSLASFCMIHSVVLTHPVMRYLFSRKINLPPLLNNLRPHSGPSPFRVYFPCYELGSGVPIGFIGRLVVNTDGPKYVFPALIGVDIPKGGMLWGLHRILGPVENLTICEGVFDAVHYPHTVALLGSSISEAQIEIIRSIDPREITVMLDGDAHEKSIAVCRKLAKAMHKPIYQVRLKDGEDPDSVRDVEVLKTRERLA